jgi:hypothetical protein
MKVRKESLGINELWGLVKPGSLTPYPGTIADGETMGTVQEIRKGSPLSSWIMVNLLNLLFDF